MLSRSFIRTRNVLLHHLESLRIQSCSIHILRTRSRSNALNTALLENCNQIISRFNSSRALEKDAILNIRTESTALSPVKVPNNNLQDIPLVDKDEVTNASSNIPEIIADAVVPLNKLGEPTLGSLGLGSKWTPVGWVQHLLEWVHVTFDLSWWATISVGVLCVRILVFPLVIKQQRNSIKMHNVMPGMQELQNRLQRAKMYGNHVETMKLAGELGEYMQKHDVNPGSAMYIPFIQAPIFISFFMGLRGMANAPVESMAEGGLWWFKDLTVMDPYYLLPLFTCSTLFATICVGAAEMSTPNISGTSSPISKYMPYILKAIPVFIFPFIMHFPAGVCVYWAATNVISLIQVLFLRIPKVRKYFKIEQKQQMPKSSNFPKTGFIKDMKSSYGNLKIAREIEERDRLDEMNFRRAGRAPPAKTYKENPLLKKDSVQAKN